MKQIQDKGWCYFLSNKKNDDELIKIASNYGTPFPDSNGNLIQKLESKSKTDLVKGIF